MDVYDAVASRRAVRRFTDQPVPKDVLRRVLVPHHDKVARQQAIAANWDCFGAPAALFCYIDRDMGAPQWADVGMYLQTVMLLVRAEGLHSCPQMAWSVYHRTVAGIFAPPAELILFCGMPIGFEDSTAPCVRIDRAPLAQIAMFVD